MTRLGLMILGMAVWSPVEGRGPWRLGDGLEWWDILSLS